MTNYPNIGLTIGKEIKFISQEQILFCKSEGNYSVVQLIDNQKLISSRNLKEFEKSLSHEIFMRVHNSFVINLMHIIKFTNEPDGSIELVNNFHIPISRRRRAKFLELFYKI